ncbi:MAG: hypothetical protein ABSG21_09445 [Spirochaetia bacterium]|jgi:hypothetical protein
MKTRKLLPLVLLAVGALFLLSSCDAILDAIFQNNQIKVDVWVYYLDHPDYNSGGTVTVVLTDNSAFSQMIATSAWQYFDGYYVHYYLNFPKLKNDNFSITSAYFNRFGVQMGAAASIIYDSSGTTYVGTGFNFTMPYSNSADSTGHSITVVQYLP